MTPTTCRGSFSVRALGHTCDYKHNSRTKGHKPLTFYPLNDCSYRSYVSWLQLYAKYDRGVMKSYESYEKQPLPDTTYCAYLEA